MNDTAKRLKILRKELNIKQGDFAKKISTTQGHISDIENGRKNLSDRTLKLICLENWNGKKVNDEWLKSGIGAMFKSDMEDELSAYLRDILNSDDEYIKSYIKIYMKLKEEQKQVLRDFAKTLADDILQ